LFKNSKILLHKFKKGTAQIRGGTACAVPTLKKGCFIIVLVGALMVLL